MKKKEGCCRHLGKKKAPADEYGGRGLGAISSMGKKRRARPAIGKERRTIT